MKMTINIALLCALLGTTYFVNAQNSNDIEKCVQTENDRLRLMCYDQLFEVSASGNVTVNSQATSVIDQVIASKAQVAAAPTSVPAQSAPAKTAVAIAQRTDKTEVATQSRVTQSSAIDQFGAEDLGPQEDQQALIKIESVIDALSENNRDIRTFTLANGQVWQETETNRLRLKVGMPIFIEKGAFSAHFLGKESSNRRVRVKRVK